jgi:uncharacterized protein with HEPN domain
MTQHDNVQRLRHMLEAEQKRTPGIPWVDIVGMRNRLIHAYMDTDLEALWATVVEDLPALIQPLETALKRLE